MGGDCRNMVALFQSWVDVGEVTQVNASLSEGL